MMAMASLTEESMCKDTKSPKQQRYSVKEIFGPHTFFICFSIGALYAFYWRIEFCCHIYTRWTPRTLHLLAEP